MSAVGASPLGGSYKMCARCPTVRQYDPSSSRRRSGSGPSSGRRGGDTRLRVAFVPVLVVFALVTSEGIGFYATYKTLFCMCVCVCVSRVRVWR